RLQPWESIDTASGNIILTFTDLELPGNNGRLLRFQRVFNNAYPSPYFPGPRWRFAISGVPLKVQVNAIQQGENVSCDCENGRTIFFMPDGSQVLTSFMLDPNSSS